MGLQDIQFALALEYDFRNWTELKQFVEHMQSIDAETEEERNIVVARDYNDSVNRESLADYLVAPSAMLHYGDESVLYDEFRRGWIYGNPAFTARYSIEDIAASGDKVTAQMFESVVDKRGESTEKHERRYECTWRFANGRFMESWLPQGSQPEKDKNAPSNSRPAISWLDKHVATSKVNEEVRYMDSLLHQMAESAPAAMTLAENTALPEATDVETGKKIATTFEHILEWFKGKLFHGKDLYLLHDDKYYIVHISIEDEIHRSCRIDVQKSGT